MRAGSHLILAIAGLLFALAGPAAAGSDTPPAPLEGTRWLAEQVGGMTIEPGLARKEPFLQLHPEKRRYGATAGCNGLGGEYLLNGEQLRLQPGISTRMFCDGPVGKWESAMRQAFLQTVTWQIEERLLVLLDGDGQETARFRASAPK